MSAFSFGVNTPYCRFISIYTFFEITWNKILYVYFRYIYILHTIISRLVEVRVDSLLLIRETNAYYTYSFTNLILFFFKNKNIYIVEHHITNGCQGLPLYGSPLKPLVRPK